LSWSLGVSGGNGMGAVVGQLGLQGRSPPEAIEVKGTGDSVGDFEDAVVGGHWRLS